MSEITIIGAGGYVGTALSESLILDGYERVRAVVRAYRSLAGLARFGSQVSIRVADAEHPDELREAIRGSSVVVNVTTGAPKTIIRSTAAILDACVREKVRRLVHLSSAVVFGEARSPSLTDDSPPLRKHWMPYARAKAASERFLRNLLESSPIEIAVLRPGIVWGPRSPHTRDIVESLLDKRAFLVDEGKGVFNGIYIDNLIYSIQACINDKVDIRGFYNVADQERVTWREFYSQLATSLDYDMARIVHVSSRHFPWSRRAAIDYLQALPGVNQLYHRLKSHVPAGVKASLKARLSGCVTYERPVPSYQSSPYVSRELWHLQRTCYKLPTTKFARRFDLAVPVSFGEGVLRTLAWLSHIGLTARETCCAT